MADLSLLLGAATFAAGMLAGRFWPARRKSPEQRKPPAPVCGCTHHLSYHDPASGECHELVKVPSTMTKDSYHTQCACRKYTGPEPLPEYYAPEIGG